MLILARKKNERIVVTTPEGEKVTVTFLGSSKKKGKIHLGIDAPKKWIVLRKELETPTDTTVAEKDGWAA